MSRRINACCPVATPICAPAMFHTGNAWRRMLRREEAEQREEGETNSHHTAEPAPPFPERPRALEGRRAAHAATPPTRARFAAAAHAARSMPPRTRWQVERNRAPPRTRTRTQRSAATGAPRARCGARQVCCMLRRCRCSNVCACVCFEGNITTRAPARAWKGTYVTQC